MKNILRRLEECLLNLVLEARNQAVAEYQQELLRYLSNEKTVETTCAGVAEQPLKLKEGEN